METNPVLMSIEEFLEMGSKMVDGVETHYEYIAGRIRAMAGASKPHAMLTARLTQLAANSAGPRCAVYTGSRAFVRVDAIDALYVPDVLGVCDPDDDITAPYFTSPCFIIEVLSPSTTKKDRREKLLAYLTLPSLEEYALVDQFRMRIEVFRRETGPTKPQVLELPEHVLEISCIGLSVPLQDIYDRVPLRPLEVRDPTYGEEEDALV